MRGAFFIVFSLRRAVGFLSIEILQRAFHPYAYDHPETDGLVY